MYLYSDLQRDMELLSNFGRVFSIGKSELGREILAVQFGKTPRILLFGAIHAREWITVPLLVELAKIFGKQKNSDLKINSVTDIAFVPMVNPDGVELCQRGVNSMPLQKRKSLLRVNGNSDFSLWKANANAVDLNVNFDAKWGSGAQNVIEPSSANYIGQYPFSESETRAIADFSKLSTVALAYHTKGEVIYYGFDGDNSDKFYADKFGRELGYEVLTSEDSAGGFKDWFVQNNLGVGLTIECGDDNWKHPISMVYLPKLIDKHKNMGNLAIEVANDYGREIHENRH
ncbi:MAG: M14 family zinc carboxypeptidase [Clostridia bacterium]|nr:M14 family zinc carboxypeptidase [Clostridia bacterium]